MYKFSFLSSCHRNHPLGPVVWVIRCREVIPFTPHAKGKMKFLKMKNPHVKEG